MSYTRTIFCAVSFVSAMSLHAQCGTDRWPVKTGTDPDASLVSRQVVPTTIAYLRSIPAPRPLPQTGRLAPVEETIYSVTATLIAFKSDGDSDYHLVLADEEGRTIIAEIPSPACSSGGVFSPDIATARAIFESKVTVSGQFKTVAIPVEIRGVGFFDFLQGQLGVAPNGIELHPVTAINFAPIAAPKPPPMVSRRRAVAPGASGSSGACVLPRLTLSLSNNNVCSGTPVTLSWQSSDPKASVAIDGVGVSLPASGSTTVGSTTPIVYSARAMNACGAGEEAVAVLSIASGASASISGPSSVQQGAVVALTISVTNASSWSLTSARGNPISPATGSNTGTFSVQYTASASGSDIVTLTATGACGSIQRTLSITVNAPQPQPQPQPGGTLRCCDGTFSPSCTNCAKKQGCCSSHGGVCGC